MDAAIERRVSVATCWASTRIAVLDSAERYEDSYALLAEEGYEPVRSEKGWMARMMDKVANAF